jgi:hypothetical protein
MKPMRLTLFTLVAALCVAGAVIATRSVEQQGRSALPTSPASAPVELVFAQPFVIDTPYTHTWRAEAPDVSSGWILVLRANAALLARRQTAEPVLYVEDETAERVNDGASGNLVVLVPSPLDASGRPVLDPAQAHVWFGLPDLPERVDAARIASELALAIQKGVGLVPRVALNTQAQLGTLYAAGRDELEAYLADLIELYSPTESDLVAGLRVAPIR